MFRSLRTHVPSRGSRRWAIVGCLLAAGSWAVAHAGQRLLTSNRVRTNGRLLNLGTDASGQPCVLLGGQLIDWAGASDPTKGESYGIALDRDYPSDRYVWASVRVDHDDASCSEATDDCWGGTRYRLSLPTLSRYLDQRKAGALPVDLAAATETAGAAMLMAEKYADAYDWYRIHTSDGSYAAIDGDQSTQIEWVDTDLLAVTDANMTSCSGGRGYVRLINYQYSGTWTKVAEVQESATFKPEGVDAFPVADSSDANCDDYDYAVYVTDYCSSRLFVYGVVSSGSSSTLTHLTEVSLGLAPGSVACHPSAVRYLDGKDKAVILCQNSETFFLFNTSGYECTPNPDWFTTSAHKALKYISSADSADGTCSDPFTPVDNCTSYDSPNCSPHDVAYDQSLFDDWFFVTLTQANDVMGVKISSPSTQVGLYQPDQMAFEPIEHELLEVP